MSSSYERLAALEVEVEAVELVGLALEVPGGWTRRTTVVRLVGGGEVGEGEDVTYQPEDHEALQAAGPPPGLTDRRTLDAFSRLLDGAALFPRDPADPKAAVYRRWAFESAALDLALRQAGRSLAAALGREARPLRFVVSTGLGDPPSLAPLEERLWSRYPGLGLKLDATPAWDDALLARLAETGAVHAVDFKGQYKGPFRGPAPDAELYRRVAEALPHAWLEDPGWTDATREALAPHMDRVTYDAPICSLADLLRVFPAPRAVNLKPSRFGLLSELLRTYECCQTRGLTVYGGGQFELGPGRGQIQLLASLFHPDSANDVAPTGFNRAELPAGLPSSPLPAPDAVGFRWGP